MTEHRTHGWTAAFEVVTTVGNTVGVAAATVIVAIVLAVRRHAVPAAALVATMVLGWVLMNVSKNVVRRERPPEPQRLVDISTYAMPSGHAMMSAIFVVAVVSTVRRAGALKRTRAAAAVSIVLAAASLLIGFSRVYLGAHWLTDVLVGWAVGALWGAVGVAVVLKLLGRGVSGRAER